MKEDKTPIPEDVKEKEVRNSLYHLFSEYSDREIREDLLDLARYMDYLSERIDYRRARINAPSDIVRSFESTVLLMRDRLEIFPADVKSQVENLLMDRSLSTTLGTLGALDEVDADSVSKNARRGIIPTILRVFSSLANIHVLQRVDAEELGLTPKVLLDARKRLTNLAQVAKFASTLDVARTDNLNEDYSDQFNTDRIDKDKVRSLVTTLMDQVSELPNSNHREKLLQSIKRLEKEVCRRRPRWTKIAGQLLILMSVLANLKTLAPDIFEKAFHTVETIVKVIQREGQVNHVEQKLLPAIEVSCPATEAESGHAIVRRKEDE